MLKTLLIFSVLSLVLAKDQNLQRFYEGNRKFSAATYRHLAAHKSGQNFLICPFSAETILGLVHNGARGETAMEMRTALHFPGTNNKINGVFKELKSLKTSEDYTLHTANKIYISKPYSIRKKFVTVAKETYQSSVETIDFTKTEEAVKTINDWVAEQTQDKIHDLVDGKILSEDTVAVLVNALYFQGAWRKHFKKSLTQKRDFYLTSDNIVQVETMKREDYFGYYESEDLDAKFLKIPFRGENVSMVVVLPNEKEGLKQLEKKLGKVLSQQEFSWDEHVEVALPKFKIESSVDFKKILKKLGMKKAFTRGDFSAMAGEKGEIYISDVLQKTYISVDESGVEAAAATAVVFHPKSLIQYFGDKRTFIVDHPFFFYIEVENVVLFTGRVVDPSL